MMTPSPKKWSRPPKIFSPFIAKNNGHDTRTVDKVLSKQKHSTKNEQDKYLGTIPYIGTRTNKFIKMFTQHKHKDQKRDLPLFTQINNNKTETTDKNNLNGI